MRINDKNIAQYLERYMDGQTSVDEERMLASYFRKRGDKPVPDGIDDEDWQVYREMFAMFEPKPQVSRKYGKHLVAASATILLAFGAWTWMNDSHNMPQETATQPITAMTTAVDSITCDDKADTLKMEVTPVQQPARKPATRKGINRNRYSDTPPLPRHYLAQAAAKDSTPVDLDDAVRQADLLMKAVYVQQQSDLHNIMGQYAHIVASIDDYSEEDEGTFY
ncbi:MAG: hypothetical protein K2H16_09340 [Prevotella sp.]|nr:hypothetical protein [Prevotella sp.]